MVISGFFLCVLMFFLPLSINIFVSIIGLSIFRKNILMRIIFTVFFSFSMAFLAYSFEPSPAFDLYRIFEKVEWLKEMSLTSVISLYSGNSEILFNLILYVLVCNFNVHFFPAFFSFLGYFLMIYMIVNYSNKKNISNFIFIVSVIIFFLTFNHMILISGIRNFFAIILFVYLIYLEKILDKESIFTHLLYIPIIFLHKSMIIFVLLRILLFFDFKKTIKIVTIFSILLITIPNILLSLLSRIISNSNILSLLNVFRSYINTIRPYSTLILIAMILFYFICIKILCFVNKHEHQNKFYEFFIFILILMFGSFRYYVLFERLIFICICLFAILLIDYLDILIKTKEYKRENKFLCIFIIVGISTFMFRNQLHEYWNYVNNIIYDMNRTSIIELVTKEDEVWSVL